jgi:hypothetical protein
LFSKIIPNIKGMNRKNKYQFKELAKNTQQRMTNKNIQDNWGHFQEQQKILYKINK